MNSILMPLFLYPVMLWVMLTALVFVTGLSERTSSRLVILDVPSADVVLMDTLQARTSLEIREDVISADSAATLIRVGELDAVVEFLPPERRPAELAPHPAHEARRQIACVGIGAAPCDHRIARRFRREQTTDQRHRARRGGGEGAGALPQPQAHLQIVPRRHRAAR